MQFFQIDLVSVDKDRGETKAHASCCFVNIRELVAERHADPNSNYILESRTFALANIRLCFIAYPAPQKRSCKFSSSLSVVLQVGGRGVGGSGGDQGVWIDFMQILSHVPDILILTLD